MGGMVLMGGWWSSNSTWGSGKYLSAVYTEFSDRTAKYQSLDTQLKPVNNVLKADHTFQIGKLTGINGEPLYRGLWTCVNELGEIRAQVFTRDCSHQEIEPVIQRISATTAALNSKGPAFFYTDRCCQDRAFVERMFPTLARPKCPVRLNEAALVSVTDGLPGLELPANYPKPVYTDCQGAVVATAAIRADLEGQQHRVVGLDCEWVYRVGQARSKVCTLQIATARAVYIFHLARMGPNHSPPARLVDELIALLRDPSIIKVGKQIGTDSAHLNKDYGTPVASYLELGRFCYARAAITSAARGLADITAQVIGKKLPKPALVRCSNWHEPLSEVQATYAALDAYASLQVYSAVVDRPNLSARLHAKALGEGVEIVPRRGPHAAAATGVVLAVQPERWGGMKVGKKHAVVRVDQVLSPAMQVPFGPDKGKTLGELGPPPFELMVHLQWLRPIQPPPDPGAEVPVVPDPAPPPAEQQQPLAGPQAPPQDPQAAPGGLEAAPGGPEAAPREGMLGQAPPGEVVWQTVLNDAFHSIANTADGTYKSHPRRAEYARALSEAIFVWNEEDYGHVKGVLEQKGIDIETELKGGDLSYFMERIRRVIPDPYTLVSRLVEFKNTYKDVPPGPDGKPLFKKDGFERLESLLEHAQNGCLSDPPGLPLYYETTADADGLMRYRCIRGTNEVEGAVHNPLATHFGATRMSLRLLDATMSNRRHRHNLRAHYRNRLGQASGPPHYSPWIVDDMEALALMLYGHHLDPQWVPVGCYKLPEEYFNFAPLSCVANAPAQEPVAVPAPPPPSDNIEPAANGVMGGPEDCEVEEGDGAAMGGGNQVARGAPQPDPALRGDYKFLAQKQHVAIPFLPVLTPQERKLFSTLLLGTYKAHAKPNGQLFEALAQDFNKAASVAGGIYMKDAAYIKKHFDKWKTWQTAHAQRSTHEGLADHRKRMREERADAVPATIRPAPLPPLPVPDGVDAGAQRERPLPMLVGKKHRNIGPEGPLQMDLPVPPPMQPPQRAPKTCKTCGRQGKGCPGSNRAKSCPRWVAANQDAMPPAPALDMQQGHVPHMPPAPHPGPHHPHGWPPPWGIMPPQPGPAFPMPGLLPQHGPHPYLGHVGQPSAGGQFPPPSRASAVLGLALPPAGETQLQWHDRKQSNRGRKSAGSQSGSQSSQSSQTSV
eukprot:comp24337_c0_seq10/m.46213 comp24337_c0_seq10/g.46213  ORF comp24337_c0_seq10/g.46213 comp24337_c0_seq10/m.46213 type:complete len:1170 (-) comp24337_c0_seq10:91-3600(-)